MQKITLDDIRVHAHIGVSVKERQRKQLLSITIEVEPDTAFEDIGDNIENTVNYSSIRDDAKALLKRAHYKLIETVATKLAHHVMAEYPVKSATVRVRKFPYKDTKSVSCQFSMDADNQEG